MRTSAFPNLLVLMLLLAFLHGFRPAYAYESFPILASDMFSREYTSDTTEADVTTAVVCAETCEGTGTLDLHPHVGKQAEAAFGFGTRHYRFTGETQQGKITLVSRLDRATISIGQGGAAAAKVILAAYELTDDGNITRKLAAEAYSQERDTTTSTFIVEKSLDLTWKRDYLYRAGVIVYVIGGSALQLTTVKVDFRLSAILFQALEDPWDPQPRPVVDALPDPTTQNKEVDVMGNDFPATQSVQVKLAGQPKATVTSQSDGSFTVRIQANVPSGDQPVVATAQTATQETGTTSLTVLPAPTPTPPAALPPLMMAAITAIIAPAIRVAKRTRQH